MNLRAWTATWCEIGPLIADADPDRPPVAIWGDHNDQEDQ